MPIFATGLLSILAKSALTAVVAPFLKEAREMAFDKTQDVVSGIIAGGMSIEEWANIVIGGIDNVKERFVNEDNLRFIGGKLKFAMSETCKDTVSVSFELYFQDYDSNWHKAVADSEIPSSKFTQEALDEVIANSEVSYDVE